jgi:hypothetical protein
MLVVVGEAVGDERPGVKPGHSGPAIDDTNMQQAWRLNVTRICCGGLR